MNYKQFDTGHCVASIIFLPEGSQWRIYVAWEWEAAMKAGFVKFYKSRELFHLITVANILKAADYGDKLSTEEAKKVFPASLFRSKK